MGAAWMMQLTFGSSQPSVRTWQFVRTRILPSWKSFSSCLRRSLGSAPWMTADGMPTRPNASASFVACSTSTQNATQCSRSNA